MENKNIEHPAKKSFFKRIPLIALIGLVAGAIGGYVYYVKVGCISGTCAITSNPWMSTAWGGALGYLIFDIFNHRKKKMDEQSKRSH